MGAKQSTAPRVRTYSNAGQSGAMASTAAGFGVGGPSTSSGVMGARTRARSLGNVQNGSNSHGLNIPNNNSGMLGTGSPDSDSSTPEDGPFARAFMHAHSLPVHLLSLHGKKILCNIHKQIFKKVYLGRTSCNGYGEIHVKNNL